MNHRVLASVCITIMFCCTSDRARANTACVSNILMEIEATLSTNYCVLLSATPRHRRAEVNTLITGALYRSYVLSQRLSPLLVSNEAAAQLVACRLAKAALSRPIESGLVEDTLRTALFDGNSTWALHVSEAILTSTVYRFESKVMLLDCACGALDRYQVSPTLTQQFIRVHEHAARVLAVSISPLERALAPRAVEHLVHSRDPHVAARGVELAKELYASAATAADRVRFTRIIVKKEEPSRYVNFLEGMLDFPDENIAFEAYHELRDLHRTNGVALRAIETKWTALQSSLLPRTNADLRCIYTP